MRRKLTLACAALAVHLAPLALSIVRPPAVFGGVEPQPFKIAIVGIARGQTARLNVVVPPPDDIIPPPDDIIPPPDDEVPAACAVILGFLDAEGAPILDRAGSPLEKTVRLLPGESAFLDLPSSLLSFDGLRTRILAVVVPPEDDGDDEESPDACAGLVATLEVFGTFTGRTQVFHSLEEVAGVDPQPFRRAFGLVGMTRGQTAVLNVLGIDPCTVDFGFLDGRGAPILDDRGIPVAKTVTLEPGVVESLELPASLLSFDGLRSSIRAFVIPAPDDEHPSPDDNISPDPCAGLVAILEVYDRFTGRTQVLFPPDPIFPPDPVVPPTPIQPPAGATPPPDDSPPPSDG